MDWFLGAVASGVFTLLGTVVGFVLGLVGAEYRDRLSRKRTKKELIERLISEVSVNRRELQAAIGKVETHDPGLNRPQGYFADTVYVASAMELALLPRDAREDLQSYYTALREVTSMVQKAEGWDQMVFGARQVLYGRFLGAAREALCKAEKAYQQLDHIVSQGR